MVWRRPITAKAGRWGASSRRTCRSGTHPAKGNIRPSHGPHENLARPAEMPKCRHGRTIGGGRAHLAQLCRIRPHQRDERPAARAPRSRGFAAQCRKSARDIPDRPSCRRRARVFPWYGRESGRIAADATRLACGLSKRNLGGPAAVLAPGRPFLWRPSTLNTRVSGGTKIVKRVDFEA